MGTTRVLAKRKEPVRRPENHASNRELSRKKPQRADPLEDILLASLVHELRAPLNSIVGFSDLLAQGEGGPLTRVQRQHVETIRASSRLLLRLVNDILNLSKIEAGRLELDCEDFFLAPTVGRVVSAMTHLAAEKKIRISTRIQSQLVVRADPVRVEQILYNLLSNAVKFTPPGGRITIEGRHLEGLARLSVRDTGVGIASKNQTLVFGPFQQVGTAQEKEEGTGLGLAVTKRLVELQGGGIWVTSELGQGSEFTVTLPLGQAASGLVAS